MTIELPTAYKTAITEFIDTYGVAKDKTLWCKLVLEEIEELDEAVEHLLKEIADVQYTLSGLAQCGGVDEKDLEVLLSRTDLSAKALQMIVEGDYAFMEALFLEVHKSNMSKLGEDGKPIYREDGKVLKGPNYKPADITRVIYEGCA